MLEKLYSVREGATELNISPHTIRAWIYQGRLKAVKLGKRVMISESELRRIVEDGKKLGAQYVGSRSGI